MKPKKKKEIEIIDDTLVNETEINPHDNLDEADIAEEIETFTRNNIELD